MSKSAAWRPIIAALSNDHARRVFAELASSGSATDSLAALSPSRARHVVTLLQTARMVHVSSDGSLSLNTEIYRELLSASAPTPRPKGIQRFLTDDGRIDSYPSNLTGRGHLLAHIAEEVFGRDEVLTEHEVNERLSRFTDDVAVLRRYLVDYGELERTRSGSEYARPSASEPP
ncbi:DUF2087 domain-containing protein [Microbacterium sp. cx-55]|uniref:DUF2087 domain-containing protein n=1 Tax=Microbacterium sp. cx-55 TaxID=2875948 RepID=UPI001CC1535E|nr:DUF2087 domain-containing protein [Microbacterium sp. cx-55]UGB34523.1 DUF2087 domain-containing protein [Microbacterium sp. cx-55]